MNKIIDFKIIKEKQKLYDLLNELEELIIEKKYAKAFILADKHFEECKDDQNFFYCYLFTILQLPFVSSAKLAEILENSYISKTTEELGDLFFDDEDEELDDEFIESLMDFADSEEDSFGFDEKLKVISKKMDNNEEYEDLETFASNLNFKEIFDKTLDNYLNHDINFTDYECICEFISKNLILIDASLHNNLILLIEKIYIYSEKNFKICLDLMNFILVSSLFQSLDQDGLSIAVDYSNEVLEKLHATGFSDLYVNSMLNYIDELTYKQAQQVMDNVAEILYRNESTQVENALSGLGVLALKRIKEGGKRKYKSILEDVRKIFFKLKKRYPEICYVYSITILECVQTGYKTIKLHWVQKEFELIFASMVKDEEALYKYYANILAELVNNNTNENEQLGILNHLLVLNNNFYDNFLIKSYYAKGIFYFSSAGEPLNRSQLETRLGLMYDIKSDKELFYLTLSHGSKFFNEREKKQLISQIKKQMKILGESYALDLAEIIVLEQILLTADGDDFRAYLNQLNKKIENKIDIMDDLGDIESFKKNELKMEIYNIISKYF